MGRAERRQAEHRRGVRPNQWAKASPRVIARSNPADGARAEALVVAWATEQGEAVRDASNGAPANACVLLLDPSDELAQRFTTNLGRVGVRGPCGPAPRLLRCNGEALRVIARYDARVARLLEAGLRDRVASMPVLAVKGRFVLRWWPRDAGNTP